MYSDKKEIIALLEEIALLLELEDANPFRIRAYHNAARALEGNMDDLEQLIKSESLTDIPGIGKGIAGLIMEYAEKGTVKDHRDLLKKTPPGLLEMVKIPGLGPKRVKMIYRRLDVKSVGELEYACKENRLVDLEGFGEKLQQKILGGIAFIKKHSEYHLISVALDDARLIYEEMCKWPEVKRASLAGSLRRHKEVIRDVDIVVGSDKPLAVMNRFTRIKLAAEVVQHGETKSQIRLPSGIRVDLRVVSDKEFPYALHHFTGSKEHNTAMRTRAKKMGMKMNEYGLFKGTRLIPCRDEEEIFKKLGLVYIPPEMREDMGEIQAAEKGAVPELVKLEDIRGVFHTHSVYSDGANTVEQMAREAQKIGYEYIGLSDHSQSARYAGGMLPADVKKQHLEIDALNKKTKNFKIFKGVESDILPDGSLDYPVKVLESFDFIIGSVHSNFNLTKEAMTRRIVRAIQNKRTTMIGHLTGRLLLARDGYLLDVPEVIRAAAGEGVVIELNANPHRLDLDWRYGQEARKAGLKVSINPDAHRLDGLLDVRFGVGIARKAWFQREDVVNAKSLKEMEKFLAICRE
ncbi:MAG: DNA polymerase/3'-5' exonuclease PolX [Candidatus Omnitrophica bacterium]|nr:DNA polymerase/3'-5' exonuclease PolX [Candidatus Omnitrophota bacterium]